MVKVTKSPNMISTTGRMPVIAAPTAIPVKPASEIGVSSTRSLPNSSTRPVRTLKTVPASAISSPQMKTRGSRRISSASASRTASPKVSSRVSGIDILPHFIRTRIWSRHGKLDGLLHFRLHFPMNLIETRAIGEVLRGQPIAKHFDRIALGFPHLLFLFRAVILTIDIAHMVSHEPVRLAHEECGTRALANMVHDLFGGSVDRPHILSIDVFGMKSERTTSRQHVTCQRLRVVGVFVVEIVFANVDHGKLPKRRHIH